MKQFYYPVEKPPSTSGYFISGIVVMIILWISMLILWHYLQPAEVPTSTYHLTSVVIPIPVVGTLDKNALKYTVNCATEDGFLVCDEAIPND